jgi:hypothetical protein
MIIIRLCAEMFVSHPRIKPPLPSLLSTLINFTLNNSVLSTLGFSKTKFNALIPLNAIMQEDRWLCAVVKNRCMSDKTTKYTKAFARTGGTH